METSSSCQDQLLRLKVASELVLGNQASVAFSRAFYLEDLLIERIFKEYHELSENCQSILSQVQKFTEDIINNDSSTSPNLSPLTESSVRCQCSEIMESLGTVHQPTLESFQKRFIHAKARRQAKSHLLEKLSAQNNNISTQFNEMTLNELINGVHIPEFSCFINDSDFGDLEKLVEDWDIYRKEAKVELISCERKLCAFQDDIERNKKMREYTCDMILAQITQQKNQQGNTDGTLKRKGVFHKFSTLLRRRHTTQDTLSLGHRKSLSGSISKDVSPTPSRFSVPATVANQDDSSNQETF